MWRKSFEILEKRCSMLSKNSWNRNTLNNLKLNSEECEIVVNITLKGTVRHLSLYTFILYVIWKIYLRFLALTQRLYIIKTFYTAQMNPKKCLHNIAFSVQCGILGPHIRTSKTCILKSINRWDFTSSTLTCIIYHLCNLMTLQIGLVLSRGPNSSCAVYIFAIWHYYTSANYIY